MNLGVSIVSIVISLTCATDPPPMFESQVVLWRHVPLTAKEWPCTVVLRNTTGHLLKVAPGDFGVTYAISETTPEGDKTTIYSEPFIEKTAEVRYPKGFVSVEPGGVITVPIRLTKMPEIAHQAFDLTVQLSLHVYSEGKVERLDTTCTLKWSPDSGQDEPKRETEKVKE